MRYFLATIATLMATQANAFDRYTIADLVDKVQPAVVNIKAEESPVTAQVDSYKSNPFAKEDKQKALENIYGKSKVKAGIKGSEQYSIGSGVVVSKEGYIITNYHVVELADKIKVTTIDDKVYHAKLVGFDSKSDLALLKLETADEISYVNFDDSNKVRVGEFVIAIGNPYGLDDSVSLGIISGRNRNIGSNIYDDFLQTDASIHPGNSGGPLFNLDGKIVGINTAIFSKNGESNGIGFAIPSNTVKLIVNQLKETGKVKRAWLGIQVKQISSNTQINTDINSTNAVLVTDVAANSPAQLAGVKPGDIILSYNSSSITSVYDLPKLVGETKLETLANIQVLRDGKILNLSAKIISDDEVLN